MYTEAFIETENGETHLDSLCRHFARRVPATLVGRQGVVQFGFGRCRISAEPGGMRLHIALDDPREAAAAERLLTEHLLRVARSERLAVHWQRHAS